MSKIPIYNAVPDDEERDLLDIAPAPEFHHRPDNAEGTEAPRVGVNRGALRSLSSIVSERPKSRVQSTLRLIEGRKAASGGGGGGGASTNGGATALNQGAPATLTGQSTPKVKWIE
jgi:hypothetical protein